MEDLATVENLMKHPDEVGAFFDEFWIKVRDAKPHIIHSTMFIGFPDVIHITQNIDNLLERTGFKDVIHYHGSIDKVIDPVSGMTFSRDEPYPPGCRPDVVMYGEDVRHSDVVVRIMKEASEVWIVGTGMEVFPFNHLPTIARNQAKKEGRPITFRHFNKTKTNWSEKFMRSWTSRETCVEHLGDVTDTFLDFARKNSKHLQ